MKSASRTFLYMLFLFSGLHPVAGYDYYVQKVNKSINSCNQHAAKNVKQCSKNVNWGELTWFCENKES
jgi:hypothetical protein